MSLLDHVDHRPWPPPAGPWVMTQTWYNLLFAHWPIAIQDLRARIPDPLEIDTFDGQGWLGIVPFGMTNVYPRFTFPVPGLSHFLELNVRTYVRLRDKPGVYFFSLDAANPLAVELARRWYQLPYFTAHMRMRSDGAWIDYQSRRTHRAAPSAEFRGRYRPVGDVYQSKRGSLEHWLTERYCLYTVTEGQVYRGEIHHLPWPLQPAQAEVAVNTMAQPHGLTLPDVPPRLHFARWIETLEWAIEPVPV